MAEWPRPGLYGSALAFFVETGSNYPQTIIADSSRLLRDRPGAAGKQTRPAPPHLFMGADLALRPVTIARQPQDGESL